MKNEDFISGWNALDRPERKQLRRLVRIGRKIDDPKLESLASGYAQYQQEKPWMRFFWLWFVPALVMTLAVAASIHPIVVGIVLALAAQAFLTHRNLKKAAGLEAIA